MENGKTVEPPKKKAKVAVDRDPGKKDLASLPNEILVNIFQYLDLRSINNCAMLCSTLNNVSKDGSLYRKLTLKHNMSVEFLKSLVNKVSCPRELYVEYKHGEVEEVEFNKFVGLLLRKCAEHLVTLKFDGCRNDKILSFISDCSFLKHLSMYRCKSNLKELPRLRQLTKIKLISCQFPQKVVAELVAHNPNLTHLFLSDNTNVNVNDICEGMSSVNNEIKVLHLSERKKLKTKSVRMLARLTNLSSLELISGTGFESDPEDSLEQLAAGCPKLTRLVIYGWKELNDNNFIPALHMFTQLEDLDLRGTNITIKSCREAALTLPLLRAMDVIKCRRIKKSQLAQLQRDFSGIDIALE